MWKFVKPCVAHETQSVNGKFQIHTWKLRFPHVTWKMANHIWLFCGYQKSWVNIHTKSIEIPCLVL